MGTYNHWVMANKETGLSQSSKLCLPIARYAFIIILPLPPVADCQDKKLRLSENIFDRKPFFYIMLVV